jgi:putative component of membrane protein insertase Oxa1/YidC/SpoIIIJ protein YidD
MHLKTIFFQLNLLVFFCLLPKNYTFSQQLDFNKIIVTTECGNQNDSIHSNKRSAMYSSSTNKKQYYNPLKLSLTAFMFLYQNLISEQISASCAYEISCSEYTKLSIEKHGIFLGSVMGFHQLMQCTEGAKEEVPDYMYSIYSSKIKNSVQ